MQTLSPGIWRSDVCNKSDKWNMDTFFSVWSKTELYICLIDCHSWFIKGMGGQRITINNFTVNQWKDLQTISDQVTWRQSN